MDPRIIWDQHNCEFPAAVQLSKILRLEQMPQLTMNLGIDDQRQVNFLVTLVKQLHARAGKQGDQAYQAQDVVYQDDAHRESGAR